MANGGMCNRECRTPNHPPLSPPPITLSPIFVLSVAQDVADMIKFSAYTCPPDSRTGLAPLALMSLLEASGILSFLVLFIGTSG